MNSIFTMRRFSKGSSSKNVQSPQSPPVSYSPPTQQQRQQQQQQPNDSRPVSSATSQDYDFTNRPISQPMSQPTSQPASKQSQQLNSGMGLSRTDTVVLKHFWEEKYAENANARDLHYLKFPYFPQYPSHKDLIPYCEVYHLIKTQPGAKIVSLGTANGVYIGFELFEGSQLHIDMDDEWQGISHYRVTFKPFDKMIAESSDVVKNWPKPLTIEFLEEEYQKWILDLMSVCWEGKEVRELGAGSAGAV